MQVPNEKLNTRVLHGAPPRGVGARGQTTSELPDFNHHRSSVLGEFLVLPRRLYLSVSALGRRNGRATAATHASTSPRSLPPPILVSLAIDGGRPLTSILARLGCLV